MPDVAIRDKIVRKSETAGVRLLETGEDQSEEGIQDKKCKDCNESEPKQQTGIEAVDPSRWRRRLYGLHYHAALRLNTERGPPLLDYLGNTFRDFLDRRTNDL